MTTLEYAKGAEKPDLQIWWESSTASLIDFSTGYTFQLKIGNEDQSALLTKTTGITGAAGSGSEPSGTPNVSIVWADGELAITPGLYSLQLKATSAAGDRYMFGTIKIGRVIL